MGRRCSNCKKNPDVCLQCGVSKCYDFDCANCVYKTLTPHCPKCKVCCKCDKVIGNGSFESCDDCDNTICTECQMICACGVQHLFCPCDEPEGQNYRRRTTYGQCENCKGWFVEGCQCYGTCSKCEEPCCLACSTPIDGSIACHFCTLHPSDDEREDCQCIYCASPVDKAPTSQSPVVERAPPSKQGLDLDPAIEARPRAKRKSDDGDV